MTERHPSANACQRSRRARYPRIDYYPSPEALAAIDAKRAILRPGSVAATNSAILDAIVAEWVELVGINKREIESAMSPKIGGQYARARMASDAERSARAQEYGGLPGINAPIRAHAYDFGGELPSWAGSWLAAGRAREAAQRVTCGARRHRDGQHCEAKSEPGKRRCRFHGGRSTGPRTPEGKAKALANLRQNKREDDGGGKRGKPCD